MAGVSQCPVHEPRLLLLSILSHKLLRRLRRRTEETVGSPTCVEVGATIVARIIILSHVSRFGELMMGVRGLANGVEIVRMLR